MNRPKQNVKQDLIVERRGIIKLEEVVCLFIKKFKMPCDKDQAEGDVHYVRMK